MGSKERRQREKEGTRQRILEAARELFVEHGYDAVTMRKLAERIEYSPTAIYVHFSDKATLMRELSICDFQVFTEAFLATTPDPDPACRLQQLGRTLVGFAQEHKNQYRLLFMTERPEPDAEQIAAKPEQDAYSLLLQAVSTARDAGLVHPDWDLDTVAQSFWSSLHGLVALHLVMPTPRGRVTLKPLMSMADTVMSLMLFAFRQAPGALPCCPVAER